MNDLNHRERELVALGAAMGSNCIPCIEYHIPEARKAGLTELTRDDALVEMIADIDQIDRAIASFDEKKKMTMGACVREAGCCRANACRSHAPGSATVNSEQ